MPAQLVEAIAAAIECPELLVGRTAMRQDLVERWTMATLQAVDGREPILDRLQAIRRPIDVGCVVAQHTGEIVERGTYGLASVDERLEARIERSQLADAFPYIAQPRQHGLVIVVECGVALGGQSIELVGVGHDLPLGCERLVLARARRDLVDLVTLELEEIQAGRAATGALFEGSQGGARGDELRVKARDLAAEIVEVGEAIEERQLRRGHEQGLVLVLPVEIDELPEALAQGGRRDELAVEERAAASLCRDLAPDDPFRAVGEVDDRLHRGGLLPGSHQVGGRSSTEQEAHGLDENRLTGARFAGQHAQTRPEFELELVDDGKPVDVQIANHRPARTGDRWASTAGLPGGLTAGSRRENCHRIIGLTALTLRATLQCRAVPAAPCP